MHMKSHNPKQEEIPQCVQCGNKTFQTRRQLNKHRREMHNHRKFQCDVCAKTFFENKGLASHMKSHTDNLMSFKCDACPKTFLRKAGLSMHIKSHTENPNSANQNEFKCSQCGDSFPDLSLLSKHKNQVHMKTNRDEFPMTKHCDTCDLTFSSRQSLKHHTIVIHTKAYPQMCDGCGKGFTNTGLGEQLANHKKSCSVGI